MKKTFGILIIVALMSVIAAVVFAHGMMGENTEGNITQSHMMGSSVMGMPTMQHMMGGMNSDNCLQSGSINPIGSADKLGLSEDQQKRVNDILVSYKKDMIKRNADREILETELAEFINQEKPDQSIIEKQVQKVANAEAGIRYSQIKVNMDVKSLLTAEQRDMLKSTLKDRNVPMMGSGNSEDCH